MCQPPVQRSGSIAKAGVCQRNAIIDCIVVKLLHNAAVVQQTTLLLALALLSEIEPPHVLQYPSSFESSPISYAY